MSLFDTERLIVKELTFADANSLASVLSNANIMKYSIVGTHTPSQIQQYIESCRLKYKTSQLDQWGIFEKSTNQFAGICGLNKHQIEAQQISHISYRLGPQFHGKGYATEATTGLLHHCQHRLMMNCIYALVDPNNQPSINVAKRSGFQRQRAAQLLSFDVDIYQRAL